MKVLLLVNKNIKNNTCYSRSYMYSLMLKEYLENFEIQVEISNLIYNGKRLNNTNIIKKIKYDNFDHIVLIDKYGFSKKYLGYVNHLKKLANISVTSFAYSNKYKKNEDAIFFVEYSSYSIKNGIHLNYFADPKFCFQENKKGIYILIDDNDSKIKDNVMAFAKKSAEYTKMIVRGIDNNMIYDYDLDGNKIDCTKIDNYLLFFDIFRKIDFYFITDYVEDNMMLADLSMCNTMIISKKGLLSKKIINLFNITEITDFVNWDLILQRKNKFNIRDKLIQNHMITENAFNKIYTYLKMKNISSKSSNLIVDNAISDNAISDNAISDSNTYDNNKQISKKRKINITQNNLLSILKN